MGVFSAVSRISQHSTARGAFYLASLYCTAELFHIMSMIGAQHQVLHVPSTTVRAAQRHHKSTLPVRPWLQSWGYHSVPAPAPSKPTFWEEDIGHAGDYVVVDNNLSVSVGGAKGPWMVQEEMEQQQEEPKMMQVPEGHVWVVGDNLRFSRDSRLYGPVPMALVIGKIEYSKSKWLDFKSFRGDNMVPVPVEEVD